MSNENKNVTLASPWVIYYKKLYALFENDPEIKVGIMYESEINEGSYIIGIDVCNHKKFEALQKLIPCQLKFGNVDLNIYIYDLENDEDKDIDYKKLFTDLFEGNDIFDEASMAMDHAGRKHTSVLFKPHVVQFFADYISDPLGNRTMLVQDVARDIFRDMTGNEVKFGTIRLYRKGEN